MADVYQATEILNRVSSDKYVRLGKSDQLDAINEFYNLPSDKKPNSFKKCSKDDLEVFFSSLNHNLKQLITDAYQKKVIELREDSKNNKIGSDLIAVFADGSQRIELKFGKETNSNIGKETMDVVFGLVGHIPSFESLCSNLREKQHEFVIDKKNGECDLSYKNLKNLVEELTNIIRLLNDQRIICIDNTQMKHLLESSGSLKNYNLVGENQIKIFVSYKKKISSAFKIAERLNLDGEWEITSVNIAKRSIRTEIWASNSSCKVKFLLNWKNPYLDKKNGVEYSAKLGVGSSNWNVWLYKC